ncbi:MAG TPA: FUSC family protein [Terracidiphilus sp.]|nr:FUSC family protein [Terracidiphilus sp.]
MTSSTNPIRQLPGKIAAIAQRMDWLRGLRAGVALSVPLVAGELLGWTGKGWAALGGFEAIVADTGGPYRTRLDKLVMLSVGGATGLFFGALAGGHLAWAVPLTLLWCFTWSYLTVLGQPFTSAGVLVQLIYICGIGTPTANWHEALRWSLLLLGGGVWAAMLSLFLWPLDAYRPARTAVAACYTELASFMASIAELAGRPEQRPALWHRLAQHHQYRIRRAVEQGWHMVANIRASRAAETRRGRQLVVLLEHADLLIARTVALAEHLENQSAGGDTVCRDRLFAGLADLRGAEEWIATLLERRRNLTLAHARAKRSEMNRLGPWLERCVAPDDAAGRFLLTQIAQAASVLESSIEAAALLRMGRETDRYEPPTGASASHFGYVMGRMAALRENWNVDALAANLTPHSLSLRHAARVALVCTADVAIIQLGHIDHGYWLLLTSLIVLQPHVSGTLRRGLERIGGTVAGGILAAVLAAKLQSELVTAAVLFPLALMSMAILPVSYAAFSFFLTPTFVLAWLPYSGDWKLALVRTANTIAGAVIAILAMLFLFPAYERDRAPKILRASLAADRRYLNLLIESWRTGARSSRLLAEARRATGLAHNDTEESLERLLAESWRRRAPFAKFATAFVTYLRRLAQSVTTLAALEGDKAWKQSPGVLARLELLARRLEWLEERTAHTTAPEPTTAQWPEGTATTADTVDEGDHPGEHQLQRMERQVDILYRQLRSLRELGWFPGARV